MMLKYSVQFGIASYFHGNFRWKFQDVKIEDINTLRGEVYSTALCSFSSDSPSELNIFGHDGDPFRMNGAQIGVFEESDEVGFRSLLQCPNGGRLESKIGLEILGNFSDQSLEGELSDQEFSRFLVSPDFSEGYSSGPVSMGFLDPSCGWGRFSGRFGCQLFSGGFSSRGLSCCLLGTGHLSLLFRSCCCMYLLARS